MKTILTGLVTVAVFCVFFILLDFFLMKFQGLELFPS